jgi:hypothetical protein
MLVEGRDRHQVCTVLLLGTLCSALLLMAAAAAAACCRSSLLLPLLLSVCNMVTVQDHCLGSEQLQKQLRHCRIVQQLTQARQLIFNTSSNVLRIVDKPGQEPLYAVLHLDKLLVGLHITTSVPAAAAAAAAAAAIAAAAAVSGRCRGSCWQQLPTPLQLLHQRQHCRENGAQHRRTCACGNVPNGRYCSQHTEDPRVQPPILLLLLLLLLGV